MLHGPPQRRASCIGISQQWRVHLRWPFSDTSTSLIRTAPLYRRVIDAVSRGHRSAIGTSATLKQHSPMSASGVLFGNRRQSAQHFTSVVAAPRTRFKFYRMLVVLGRFRLRSGVTVRPKSLGSIHNPRLIYVLPLDHPPTLPCITAGGFAAIANSRV